MRTFALLTCTALMFAACVSPIRAYGPQGPADPDVAKACRADDPQEGRACLLARGFMVSVQDTPMLLAKASPGRDAGAIRQDLVECRVDPAAVKTSGTRQALTGASLVLGLAGIFVPGLDLVAHSIDIGMLAKPPEPHTEGPDCLRGRGYTITTPEPRRAP